MTNAISNGVNKKAMVGDVVSDKMKKTVVVSVVVLRRHPKYRKTYFIHKHYKAHDENGEYHVGDKVEIEESRQISKDKKWRVVRKVK